MCDGHNHNLTEIYYNIIDHIGNSESVKWCKNCGSVVVDIDSDGKTFSGRVMSMKFPTDLINKMRGNT